VVALLARILWSLVTAVNVSRAFARVPFANERGVANAGGSVIGVLSGSVERLRARTSRKVDALQEYRYTGDVKATIEIPDALYRQIKARSALCGRSVRDVTIEAYRRWLAETPATYGTDEDEQPAAADAWLAAWDALAEEIAAQPADVRTPREILLADRR
jgi:hypothetical protein